MRAAREALDVLREKGDTGSLWDKMLSWDERQSLIGLPGLQALENRLLDTNAHSADNE